MLKVLSSFIEIHRTELDNRCGQTMKCFMNKSYSCTYLPLFHIEAICYGVLLYMSVVGGSMLDHYSMLFRNP